MSTDTIPLDTLTKVHRVLCENLIAPRFPFLYKCMLLNEDEFPDWEQHRKAVYLTTFMAILQSLYKVSADPMYISAWESVKADMMDGSPDSKCDILDASLGTEHGTHFVSVTVNTPQGLIEMSLSLQVRNPLCVTFATAFPSEDGDFRCETKTVYFDSLA